MAYYREASKILYDHELRIAERNQTTLPNKTTISPYKRMPTDQNARYAFILTADAERYDAPKFTNVMTNVFSRSQFDEC